MASSSVHLHFKGPYLPQNWSLPDSLIYYITKTPSNSKAWQKLIQSCKYFFAKNSILVIDKLFYAGEGKGEAVFKKVKNGSIKRLENLISFSNILCKFWLTETFSYIAQPSNLLSSIIPYFYRCDIKRSQILNQEITYDQFEFFFSKVEVFYLNDFIVRNKDDEIVPFEKLIKALPKIEKIHFNDKPSYSSITSNTVKELFKIPHISKITEVVLWKLPEKFDLETFCIYFKKNKHTKFRLHFADTISEAYKIRIEEIVDEIIAAENHGYKIPYIYFGGLPNEKWEKVDLLICQQNKQ